MNRLKREELAKLLTAYYYDKKSDITYGGFNHIDEFMKCQTILPIKQALDLINKELEEDANE